MNYNPPPKAEFIKSAEAVKHHHELVEDEVLRQNIAIALAEMNRRVCNQVPAENMGACAAGYLRMLGAQDFVEIFLNLAETPSVPTRTDTTNLPTNVQPLRK